MIFCVLVPMVTTTGRLPEAIPVGTTALIRITPETSSAWQPGLLGT